MRILSITRTKSFVGSLVKAKVYIEDALNPELTINGTPCRKLGDLKNGQQQSFEIGTEACKVYVIADKVSRNYCCEYYCVPAGQEPVSLSGKFTFDPGRGNAFRFDGNNSEEIVALRKKGKWKGWIVILAAALVGGILGYTLTSGLLNKPAKDKTFRAEGMEITLTEDFSADTQEQFTASYKSKAVYVSALKESFSEYAPLEDYTLDQYGETVMEVNGLDGTLKHRDGLTYFEYDKTVSSEDIHYTAFVYRSEDAFWLIQFFTKDNTQSKYEKDIFKWASTVRFYN